MAAALTRSAAGPGPVVPAGHPVRAAHRDRLGRSTSRTRLRLGDDLLAPATALDRGGRVRSDPPDTARQAERGEPDRLVESGDGRQSHRREKGGAGTGPSSVHRGKPGSKHHLICDDNGTLIYVLTSGANVPDIKRTLDLLDCYSPIAGRAGTARRRFATLLADKAYSSAAFRRPAASAALNRSFPSRKPPGSRAWANCATSSSRPSPCSTSSAGSPCAGNEDYTS